MKLVISLNKKEFLYDYMSMGIHTYVLGGLFSAYCPYEFSLEEIKELVNQYPQNTYYVLVNALYDEHVIEDVETYIDTLYEIGVHGLLYQDFGVLQIVKEKGYSFDMMYSPETLNTNANTLNTLSHYGMTSAFLSKVIPMQEQLLIQKQVNIPVMIQCHGVEYIAASKRELLTNYQKASNVVFDKSKESKTVLQAHSSDYQMYVYEDDKGTHIFSRSRLYTIDLFTYLHEFDYLYIETLFMSDREALEVASLYSDAQRAYEEGTYNKEVKNYLHLIEGLHTPLDRGFLFDQTVYKLEDVRKMDNEKSESNR